MSVFAAGFGLSSLKVKHKPMQILSKCKYDIYMMDPQRHIRTNRADTEGGKPSGNARLHLHRTGPPDLTSVRPQRAGRAAASTKP